MPTNLNTGQVLPGFYGYVDYNTQGGGVAPTKRVLLWANHSSSAQWNPNTPRLPASQQECDDGAGRGSDLASAYASAVSQPESQDAEIWVMPITANSSGVAPVYKFKVFVSNTNPAKSGTLQMWLASKAVPAVGFTSSDTASTIASALCDALNTMSDSPIGTATVSTDTVTLPYMHKGTVGEDFPIRCNISPGSTGVALSPGQALFSGSAGAGGTVSFTFGARTVTASISNSNTAAQTATAVIAAFNADTYPLYAVVDGSAAAQANLFFTNDMDVRRITAAVITTTTQTLNLGSGATDGTGSASSYTYNGTLGTGAPTLTTALSNLATLGMFRSWASPWLDTTTIGAQATNIEAASDGSISGQKQQTLTLADSRAASVAGAILTGTTPNLTTAAPHYAMCWCPDGPVQNMGIAARVATARASKWLDDPQFNWNGFQLKGSERAPILSPAAPPSELSQNSALRTYALAPIVKGQSGNLQVVKGRTTALLADKRLWAWSTEAQAAFHAIDLAAYYKSLFQGGSIVRYSDPKAAGVFDVNSVKSATQARMRTWEANGNYDGADALADGVVCTVNINNPFRFDVKFPESPVLDLDQIVFTGLFSQPSV